MVDLYGRRKSGVTLTVQVDAYSHQKSSCPITSFDDLLGKSVNSAMNGEIFFLKWSQPFYALAVDTPSIEKTRMPGQTSWGSCDSGVPSAHCEKVGRIACFSESTPFTSL